MILSIVVLVLFATVALIIALPYLLALYLRSLFSTVQMKLYSPFSLRGLLINGPTSSWGLSHFTLFVSAIELGWSPHSFKLRLNFANVQLYLSRRMASLCPVNLIEGNQEANILYNFAHLLFPDLANPHSPKPTSSRVSGSSRVVPTTTLAYFLEGLLHLFLILVMRTFEVVVSECRVFIVSGIPEKMADFGCEQSRKESLMLMQCLSEYSLKCDLIRIEEQIEQHNRYRLAFWTEAITADSFNHYEKKFIELESVEMQLIIPYSMSLRESLQQLKFIFRIRSASLNLVVADFEHFFQLVREVLFDLNIQQHPQSEASSEKEVCVYVGAIKANLREIFEAEFDNSEAQEYLSNLCDANLELLDFCLEERTFSIAMSTLSVVKFCRLTSEQRELKTLTVPALQIVSRPDEETIEIRHEDVVVDCQSEEVAFFGKVFSLVNERIRFENYNEEIYRELRASYQPQGTLVSQIEGLLRSGEARREDEEVVDSQLRKLVYSPKRLVVLLKMQSLAHVITIEGFNYCRYRNLNEMSHEIIIARLSVEHRSFKEFLVNDFSLTFSETRAEKQLSMAIKDISMQQNQETLIDYLDSFTLFKHLLQFESDEKQRPVKLFKKYIFIGQITAHFDSEQLSLTSLKIDKEASTNELMNTLYFSLERCQILLSHARQAQKEPASATHVLFAIDSLSLRTVNEQRADKIKPKTTLIVRGPTFNLPSSNVSRIILSYIKVYAHLQSHIEAFIINVTSQKLKALKYHFKEAFAEPEQLTLIVTSLSLSISDKRLDSNLLAFHKTVREYLSQDPKFNEAELLTVLRRNNKATFPLLALAVDSLHLEAAPLALQPNERSANEWIRSFEALNEEASRNNTEVRCRSIRAERLEARLRGVSLRVRDYASPIFSCREARLSGERLKVRKIVGSRMNYVKGEADIGEVAVSVGLGQLSGWQEVSRRMSELNVVNEAFQREFQGRREELTVWHRIIGHYKWRLQLTKDSTTRIQILTGDTPYNGDRFELEIGRVFGESTTRRTSLVVGQVGLFLREFQMVRLPRLEVSLEVRLRGTELDVRLLVRTGEEECAVSVASWIIGYLEELVQLKKDWLLIYGIYQREVRRSSLQLEDIQNMTYLEIASLLAQQRLNESTTSSLLNYLNHFQCTLTLRRLSVSVVEHDLQLVLEANDVEAFLLLQPDHDLYNELKVRRSKLTCQSLGLAFNKHYSSQGGLLRETRLGSEGRPVANKHYEFFRCGNLVVNFNWYFSEGEKMGLASQWVSVETLSGEVSKRMERYCSKMKGLLATNRISQRKPQEKPYERPINKFRKAVLEIIQINRRRKILRGHIKKYNTVVSLQRYKLLLRSEEKTMTLEGRQRGLFFRRIQYGEEDKYHSQPCEIVTLMFPASTIVLSSQAEGGSFEVVRAGQLTLEIEMSDEKVDQGKLLFEDINIELGLEGKNILESIISFVIDIANSSEERRKMYNIETAKYEELVNNGADRVKEKIEWKQSDIRRKEKEIFQWHFVLKNVAVLILSRQTKILSATIDKTEMAFHLFDNQKIQRKIVFKWLQVFNELEPLDSEYRRILQLGRENVGMAVISDTYEVNAFSEVLWSYHKELSFWVEPIKLRLTEEMLTLFIEFVGSSRADEATVYDEIKEYKNKTPDYFKLCSIEPVNLQLWFRSANIFKSMEAIKVHLEKYELRDKFYTQKQLGRAIGFWLIKQIGSQIFSLLGQKLFGDDEQ